MTGGQVGLAAAAGGLLCLERKTWAQLMLSRPIVVAPIVAAILGDARIGFALGIPLELVFLGTASYGASTPLHETLAALFAASCATAAASVQHGPIEVLLPIAFFTGLPFAVLGRSVEAMMEMQNVGLVDRAEEILSHGNTGQATRNALLSILGTLLLGIGVTFVGALVGFAVGASAEGLPRWLERGLTYAWPLTMGTAAALAIRTIRTPRAPLLSAIAAVSVFAIAAVVLWSGVISGP